MRHRILAALLLAVLTVACVATVPVGADSWSLSPINPTMYAGWTPSLALDAGLQPHVAYWNPGSYGGVSYARFDGSAWQNETIPYAAEPPALPAAARPAGAELIVTYETHLALTPDGTPWIAYSKHDQNHGDRGMLVVTHKVNGAWVNEIIDEDDSPFDMVADAAGTLWLLYHSSTTGTRLAVRNGGAWSSEPMPLTIGDLVLDRSGTPCIAYSGGPPTGIWIARRDGPSIWTSTQVDTCSHCGGLLQFDAANRPRVAYMAYEPNFVYYRLRFAAWNGTGWDRDSIPAAGIHALLKSFTLDAADNPLLAYQDNSSLDAEVAHRSGGTWVVDVVDAFGNSGTFASLIADPLGRPWMAYQANSGLWLARTQLPVGVGDLPPITATRLAIAGANPVRSGAVARLRFESPHAGAVRVETFDVSGRRLGGARTWTVAAGATELPWNAPSAPGLFLVRATPDDGRPASARVMVVH